LHLMEHWQGKEASSATLARESTFLQELRKRMMFPRTDPAGRRIYVT
jgi:hypothetical protein